ncbi:hypothetical protein DMI65_08485 [Escherichia coli]|nr:hypothetical protein [Escherichia coli]
MNASGCYAGRNYHDHLTTKTRNGTGRGAGIAGGHDAGDHHAFRADAATTGERAASRNTSRRCGTAPVQKARR